MIDKDNELKNISKEIRLDYDKEKGKDILNRCYELKKKSDKWNRINTFLGNYKKNKVSKGLYLSGNFGSGKTYLISALFNELAKEGVKSAIVFWPEFLRDLKAKDIEYHSISGEPYQID